MTPLLLMVGIGWLWRVPGLNVTPHRGCRKATLAPIIVLLWLCGTPSHAAEPQRINLRLVPTLGPHTPRVPGWNSFVAEVTNPTSRNASLTLYLIPTRFAAHAERTKLAQSRARVVIAPRATQVVHLQANGTEDGQFTLLALAPSEDRANLDASDVSSSGQELAHRKVIGETHWSLDAAGIPYLVELPDNRATSMPEVYRPRGPSPSQRFTFSRSAPSGVNGRYALPVHAAEYAAATAVIAPSTVLNALSEPEWRALVHWIAAGGALFIADATSHAFEGSRVSLFTKDVVDSRPSGMLTHGLSVSANASNPNHWIFETEAKSAESLLPPLTYEQLGGFSGPGWRETASGSVQSYGLGEVHLLGFNPQAPSFAGLTWTEDKLSTLMEAAWLRRRHLALPLGRQRSDDARSYAVRQQIDAAQLSRRWAYLMAGASLLYGTMLFACVLVARRKRHPRFLGLIVAVAALTTLLVFVGARHRLGPHERAHHLSLLELGAGMGQGPRTLYRQLTGDAPDDRAVSALAPRGLVSIVAPAGFHAWWNTQPEAHLTLRAKQLNPSPRALLVREDSVVSFGAGVHLTQTDGELAITNRSGKTLAAVVVRSTDGRVTFFESIADRQRVQQSEGRVIRILSAPPTAKYFPLLLESFERQLEEVVPGLAQTWASVEALRSGEVDWWPPDVPVLIACIVGGSGALQDSHRPVTIDRSLVRVVGYGGRP